ncbi:MAG: hypothetical protein ACRDPY_15260 [Streptosporangiaceae bacterium]
MNRPEHDEVLEAVARDELLDLGLDDEAASMTVEAMRDEGMFDREP